jgi:two-component system phosphate regulon sensor histidine kinase PhoR
MNCAWSIGATATLLLGVALLWHWRFRAERRRLELALAWLVSGGTPERLRFLESGSLAPLLPHLEQLGSELGRLRVQVQQEAFNLQSIMASMEEAVMIVDDRHVIRLVNPSFGRMFQLQREPIGLTILHTLRDTTVQELVSAALRTEESQTGEFSVTGGKTDRTIVLNCVAVRDTTGRPSVLAIFRDVSRLKQLEKVRREFVANVSHELRTPLSIFHGYVEHLLDNPDLPREDLAGILQILKRHSTRLNALLEDLLTIARLEARTEVFRPEPIDLQKFAPTVAQDWAAKLREKGVSLRLAIPKRLPPLNADPLRLEQVICNLLENALKYTASGGSITLGAEVDAQSYLVRVDDTGTGILPQDLPHIFERFYRADKARTRDQGGTGLGLSIVKHIVQCHGGSVTASSVYGQGTSIVLRFPLAGRDSRDASDELLRAGSEADVSGGTAA